ncbi:MAG: ATP-dependent DNA helicase [Gammaproteobacteria bacterium]|nr:ATP-dependent DNA helicase [Gammaproteobacteria bacterium]
MGQAVDVSTALARFQPEIQAWFSEYVGQPTAAQAATWSHIAEGTPTLVAAPTGSGKTLAAFLQALDELLGELRAGPLPDETRVVYISPLKALSNDIHRNLEAPLAAIQQALERSGVEGAIRAQVRTGDTPAAARQAMVKYPPHILVTTPESLFILLTSEGGRRMLGTARTVIVDEIHALASNKRGAHLSLSLERLDALCGRRLRRIGLSATQRPAELLGRFLVGQADDEAPAIVDTGHHRKRDLALLLPDSPLEAVMSADTWEEIYDKLHSLIEAHRTTLIFVNTRRLAERIAARLSERLGEANVAAHHGSLSRKARFSAEHRLRNSELRVLVATASLELGIDIGDVDLVVQISSPKSIGTFLQRVGRSGHGVNRVPKGRLVPVSRDDLAECVALLNEVKRGNLDRLTVPTGPLDVLAQQIVAEVACGERGLEELLSLVRGAFPYRSLAEEQYTDVVRMLSEGYATRRGRRGAYLHLDGVNRRLRPRRAARLTALTSGGAIPETADYAVVQEPAGLPIGTLNEDFAIESLPGDIFQLGNTSWRILRVEASTVRVEDAGGLPPTLPFWLGEAPGRTDELSAAVSRQRRFTRTAIEAALERSPKIAPELLARGLSVELERAFQPGAAAAAQLANYYVAAHITLSGLPDQTSPCIERFFDESGGMQLVIHAPFGSRINRAWGLALRKRFCRQFNFELQAAATEDSIILSLGETHSFPLDDVARFLSAKTLQEVLEQAVLASPMFTVRWRWNANIALAVPRFYGGKKVPAPVQRMQSEDLISVVFPDQLACAENLAGHREIPDHPLVAQTLLDTLHEAMDLDGTVKLLEAIERGEVRLATTDTTEPSPLASEVLSAKPYAYLDDAPLEERRTRAVVSRRWLNPGEASDLAQLDADAIARVRAEAWPDTSTPDDLHDALMTLGFMTDRECEGEVADVLLGESRVRRVQWSEKGIWCAAERLTEFSALYPEAFVRPSATPPAGYVTPFAPETALVAVLRSRLSGVGPVAIQTLASQLALPRLRLKAALTALEAEGFALRGSFSPEGIESGEDEWCERRLLARIHRYTVSRLRSEIEPVSAAAYMRFLFQWHGIGEGNQHRGPEGLTRTLEQLAGVSASAQAWEHDLLPIRVAAYSSRWLDQLCLSGQISWLRPAPDKEAIDRGKQLPVAFVSRRALSVWGPNDDAWGRNSARVSPIAQRVVECLQSGGAQFAEDLADRTSLLAFQIEDALRELVGAGLVTSDGFGGLRALLRGPTRRNRRRRGFVKAQIGNPLSDEPPADGGGRWSALRLSSTTAEERLAAIARTLLTRYGVVCKRVLARESGLPPWRDLLSVYRRLEDRGEVRGGRFVAGFAGEQFALPEAVAELRSVRSSSGNPEEISLSAVDPLNLAGIITPGQKVPAMPGNRVLYRDGIPVAAIIGGRTEPLVTAPAASPGAQVPFGQTGSGQTGTGQTWAGIRRLRQRASAR